MLQARTGTKLTKKKLGGTIWQAKLEEYQGPSRIQVDPSHKLLDLEVEMGSDQHSPQRK